MSQMTTIQRDAMAMALRGDWRLADAMELLHRAKTESDHEGRSLSHGLLECGRLRVLVYTASVECDQCDGTGVVECCECEHQRECSDCNGFGGCGHGDADVPDILLDLNGDEVTVPPTSEVLLTIKRANELIDHYNAGRLPEAPNTEQKELLQCA